MCQSESSAVFFCKGLGGQFDDMFAILRTFLSFLFLCHELYLRQCLINFIIKSLALLEIVGMQFDRRIGNALTGLGASAPSIIFALGKIKR